MSLAISALRFPNPSFKSPHSSFYPSSQNRLCSVNFRRIISHDSTSSIKQSVKRRYANKLLCFSSSYPSFLFGTRVGFVVGAENGDGESTGIVDEAEEEARGQSTLPDRFRPLTKEAPDPPIRWPWLIVVAFLLYAWRTVLWELSSWKKVIASLVQFVGYLLKLTLALIFHFIGDPITTLIRGIETTLYILRASYSSVVAYTPVPELTVIIILVSTVLAIAEAAVPDSVESQRYLLTVAGIIGYAAVRGSISEPFFWTLLLGLFGFGRFVKKRDYVSSLLPIAAVFAGVGQPWVRFLVMTSFLTVAITHHAKKPIKDEGETDSKGWKVPLPLLFAGMAIGVHVAAKWAGYRHLTWMIV